MRQIICAWLSFLFVFALCSPRAQAEQREPKEQWAPFQVALINPLQMYGDQVNIGGLRLDLIYGRNKRVVGFDFGFFNKSEELKAIEVGFANYTEVFRGIQLGVVNAAMDDSVGLQAGLFNGVGRNGSVIQVGLINDTTAPIAAANKVHGLEVGLLNMSLLPFSFWGPEEIDALGTTEFSGLEVGLANGKKQVNGVSVGLINTAYKLNGVQIGAVNFCEEAAGFQLGFINIISQGTVPFLPVINADW